MSPTSIIDRLTHALLIHTWCHTQTCAERLRIRRSHPTIQSPELALQGAYSYSPADPLSQLDGNLSRFFPCPASGPWAPLTATPVLQRFAKELKPPTPPEGFDRMYDLLPHDQPTYTRQDLGKILCEIQESPSTRGSSTHPSCFSISWP